MAPYENIVIGNFLYGFGVAIGQLSAATVRPMCVNLMQQTPLDHALGDLMIENGGVTRLLEFKRKENDSEKEEAKRRLLSRSISDDPRMQSISREIHWYIETSEKVASFVSRVVPYLDFADPSFAGTSIERFTNTTANDAVSRVIDDETRALYKEYLNIVATSHGGLQGASGGLVVNYSKVDGLRYVLVSDIRDLILDHSLVRKAFFEQVKENTMELNREQAVRSRGRSLTREIKPDGPTLEL